MVVGQNFKLRLDHLEVARRAARLDLAIERDHLSGLEPVFEIRAVEPHRLERSEVLADGHLEDRHRPRTQQYRASHLADDAGHLAGLQRVDGGGVKAVFVAEGEVVEQVFDTENVLFSKGFGNARANAFHELDRCVERGHSDDASSLGRRLISEMKGACSCSTEALLR